MTFDGFNKMSIGATNGATPVESFGYALERSTSASGPWTVLSSDIVVGASTDVAITQAGFYRAKVQGTAGGAAVVDALPMEIKYTPAPSSTSPSLTFDAESNEVSLSSPSLTYEPCDIPCEPFQPRWNLGNK